MLLVNVFQLDTLSYYYVYYELLIIGVAIYKIAYVSKTQTISNHEEINDAL